MSTYSDAVLSTCLSEVHCGATNRNVLCIGMLAFEMSVHVHLDRGTPPGPCEGEPSMNANEYFHEEIARKFLTKTFLKRSVTPTKDGCDATLMSERL